tara:strand:- start:539 stop:973 length:435 start_codon:yes stop_codon:yes gene_type:complete
MPTMREIVQDAMEEIGVKTAEVSLTGDELQSGIRRCNDMLTEWADIGIVPGFNEVTNGDDLINVDRNAIGCVKYNLAIRIAPSYQKVVGPALAAIASGTLEMLMASVTDLSNIAYPDTLPMGSGNRCSDDSFREFFPANKKSNF